MGVTFYDLSCDELCDLMCGDQENYFKEEGETILAEEVVDQEET